MKDLIKQLLREGLRKENELEEGKIRNAIAGGLMGLGALAGGKAQAQEVPKQQTTQTAPMFGTPEQRAAKKAQRDANVKKIERDYISSAVNAKFFKPIDDMEYNEGMNKVKEIPFFERRETFAEMGDGTKIKVFIKDFGKFLKKRSQQSDADRYQGELNKTNANGEVEYSADDSPEANRKHCTAGKCAVDRAEKSGELKNK